ncbi:E3 ubiquitin-protein ligase TRIM71-like [Anneissia japonica]|uniref:E3 ubiquitin-protein ligase TRIM71-like n=1 Tax=Anneissia japonica TaxID=1529436 RepID=UPI001425AC2B|nr:E3 ubiquitin-protein ligase TRIM71-like [Anneissia japonica]
MSVSKALEFMDKKDLECAICLNRFHQPKTLKCMHTYCLQCIEKWVETHGKMKCPTCGQEHDLTKEDLKQLTSKTMISQLLEYIKKTEEQKPTKCSFCDNQPAYHCSRCQLYLCRGQCFECHEKIPTTKDHPLYTLDIKEQDGSSDKTTKCPTHSNITIEFYCCTCNKSACKQCEHILRCYQKQHNVIPISVAIDKFNEDATEVFNLAKEMEKKLTKKLDFIKKDRLLFDSQITLCTIAIEIQEKNIIEKVQKKSKELMLELEEVSKEKKEHDDSHVRDIDLNLTQVNDVMTSINTIMNKPEETETLGAHKTVINAVRDKVLATDFDKSFTKNSTPNYIPSTDLDELMNTEGLGKIRTTDSMKYEVAEDDETFTVTKGESFVVKVSSQAENDERQLAATLINPSGEKSATDVEYQGSGEYRISGRCNVEGDWQMKITAGAAQIKGSPVNVKVETLGLVLTIDNISDFKEHQKNKNITGVELDRDGCILVLSASKDILKFNQSGSYVARIQLLHDAQVDSVHQMADGHMLYSDNFTKRVVMCDDKFQEIRSFGKGTIRNPWGLTVNRETRVLYVADYAAHCVFKFNVDDGRMLGKIGSEGSKEIQMYKPEYVTLTKEGYVIVVDFGNNRLQMFDANDKFMRILVGCGKEDGKVRGPHGVTMDMDENIIVSSNDKLQLFDKNGVFIKRIDHEDDGLDIPAGITVISYRPRRVAVRNYGANNVKIFNY